MNGVTLLHVVRRNCLRVLEYFSRVDEALLDSRHAGGHRHNLLDLLDRLCGFHLDRNRRARRNLDLKLERHGKEET